MVHFLARSMFGTPCSRFWTSLTDGVPMELESSKCNSTLVLVSTKSPVRLKFLSPVVWSLFMFSRGLYERLMNAINPEALVDLEKLLTGQNRLYES